MNLSKNIKASQAITIAAGAAGATDIEGATLDMTGFQTFQVVVQIGPVVSGAATSFHIEQSADGTTWADLEGTSQTIADDDDNTVLYSEVVEPTDRYVRVYVDRATQNATVAAMYYQGGAVKAPVTHGTGVSGEFFVSPDEGTA